MFKQTPALSILNNPEAYKEQYTRPDTIINFINTFIPNPVMRNYTLGFIKRKLTSFKYSPVVLYFLGAHGSGKDTFVKILANILGDDYVARPAAKEFVEQFNGWVMDKYFIQLDEYGNQLSTLMDKETALGKIKMWSGKPTLQIRQMRTDGFNYDHFFTLILTANSNPLMLETGDRRVAMIDTPNVLKNMDWVEAIGGVTIAIDKIDSEINDFCYYLATEIDAVSWDEYMDPPETESKHKIIASKLPAGQRIAYYLKHSLFEDLEELADEANCMKIFNYSDTSRILEDDLFDLYTHMTEGRGTKRGLTKIMREHDYEKQASTVKGHKAYFYKISTLYAYQPTVFNDETAKIEVDGLKGDDK